MKLEHTRRHDEVGSEAPTGSPEQVRARAKTAGTWAIRLVAVALVIAAGAWAYSANARSGRAAMDMTMRVGGGDTPFPVIVLSVERAPISGTVVYTGTVAPFNEEDVYPRVTGRIVEMPVYPGDAVRAGQVVARLDSVELTSRVREAEAAVVTAQATRAQMDAEVAAARHGIAQMEKELAMVEADLTYARAVAARSEQLVNVGAISRQEYENDRAMATSQTARRDAAQAKLEQARAMESSARRKLEAADAMMAQSRAVLNTASVVRDYVTLVAPTSGYVVKRLVAPGVLVQPGMALMKIAQIDRVRLQANVGEKDVASIRVGSPVAITTTNSARAPGTARVTSVFPFVDQGPRTAVVEAIVENAGRRFLPGQYVTMQFVTSEKPDALAVPAGAVSRMSGRAKVWVARDGRAEPRDVATGLQNADRVEVTSGLTGNERVVVRGQEGLHAGARIAEVGASAPASPKVMPEMPGMAEDPRPAPAKEPRPDPVKENSHAAH